MGAKCLGSQKNEEDHIGFPKFCYLTTEAAMKIKFTSPDKIEGKRIPFTDPTKRLPANALTCKMTSYSYIIVGGINLYRWMHCAEVYELDFNSLTVTSKAECPVSPVGGSLYKHNRQVYLISAAYDPKPSNEADIENSPYPFKKSKAISYFHTIKNLKPTLLYRYSTVRDRWKEVVITEDNWDETADPQEKLLPHKLLLPGTCKVDEKIFFFSGLAEIGDKWEANEKILWFSLESRKIGIMQTRFIFGGFTEMKCARVNKKRIFILGGFDKDGSYNRLIFRYTIDSDIKTKKENLKEGQYFCDNNAPIGKYRYGVFFGYPTVFILRHKTKRKDYLSIRCESD